MSLHEQLHNLLLRFGTDDPDWRDVYDLAKLLERENVKSPHGLHIRLRQWRQWRGERRNGATQ